MLDFEHSLLYTIFNDLEWFPTFQLYFGVIDEKRDSNGLLTVTV